MNAETPSEPHTIPFDLAARDLGVLVGFDGSPNSEGALAYAARVAVRRELPLTVLTVYRVPMPVYTTYVALPASEAEGEERKKAAAQLLEGAAKMLEGHPGKVSYLSAEGDSVGMLAEASARAQLVVVGAQGRGGFLGRVMGSVSTALPAHAQCPTVVVPPESEAVDGRVIVGVDGSSHGRRASLHAAREAVERGTSLLLLTALQPPDRGEYWFPMLPHETGELVDRRRTELEEQLEQEVQWLTGHVPEVQATAEVRVGSPASVLREAMPTTQLTVVGSHGRGAISSALLGSVSRATLHGAERPVMVVPPLRDDRVGESPLGR